jgi:hypothetical protein
MLLFCEQIENYPRTLIGAGEGEVGEWVGRVEGGPEQADRLAAEAGLINLGEVIPGTWLINLGEVIPGTWLINLGEVIPGTWLINLGEVIPGT